MFWYILGILTECWVECWWLVLLAKTVSEHQVQILQNTYNTKKKHWVHQIQSPACLSLDFINELLDKMHSWYLYVHALYMMVGSSWILISCTLWNGLPKDHTCRKSRPLRQEIPHWAPIKKLNFHVETGQVNHIRCLACTGDIQRQLKLLSTNDQGTRVLRATTNPECQGITTALATSSKMKPENCSAGSNSRCRPW